MPIIDSAEIENSLDTSLTELYESELFDEEIKQTQTTSRSILVFRLSSEWFGVEAVKVKEIREAGIITYIPMCPQYIGGIANIRGKIQSVLDLRYLLNLNRGELSSKAKLIIVGAGELETGLIADETASITEVSQDKISAPLSTIGPDVVQYLEGAFSFGGKMVSLLKIEEILNKRG